MITFGWASLGVAVAAAVYGLGFEWWYWRPKRTWRDELDDMVLALGPYIPKTPELVEDGQVFSSAPLRLVLGSRPPRRETYTHLGYRVEPIGTRWRVIEHPGTNQGRTFPSRSAANEHIRMRLPPGGAVAPTSGLGASVHWF